MGEKSPFRIPFLTDDIASLPFIGKIKGYYVALALLFIFYLLTKNALVGLTAGALIVAIVVIEFAAGAKEGGLKNEIIETAGALALALLLWFGASFLLATPTPVNAIVSCSMLPSYERGDMVLLQGGVPNAPIVDIAGDISSINSTAKIAVSSSQTPSASPQSPLHSSSFFVNGSLYAYCAQKGSSDTRCADFIANPEKYSEYHGELKINYEKCTRVWPAKNGATVGTNCAASAEVGGQKISLGRTNDLIVYAPKSTDIFGMVGDIVHRTAFILRSPDGSLYYFTKGDNNPIYDFQFYEPSYARGNSPVAQNQSKGKVIARLPYIGNLKLFITPQVLLSSSTESGCDSHYSEN